MKKSRLTFLIAEFLLALLTLFLVIKIFPGDEPQKRVAVIVENSGDEKWDAFINGMKQAAALRNIHLIICNTDEIENAQEEEDLIYEQLDNNVDAFIVQAAPGPDVLEMLGKVAAGKPMILVANDALTPELTGDIHAASNMPRIMPDNYEMGYQLGLEMLRKDESNMKGKTVGIVSGLAETDSAEKRQQGLKDALADSGCKISWQMNTAHEQNLADMVKNKAQVDYIAALETEVVEQLGKMKMDGGLETTQLYGVGNSLKCVYLLDDGMYESLVMADGYGMGYDSVLEMADALESNLYNIQNHVTEIKVLQKEDIFTEENQQFLHTYK